MQRPKQFTLIEMLVVIAIISILAAMLMPGLKSALQSARQAGCGSNQRQLGIALSSYSGDYEMMIPGARAFPTFKPIHWGHYLYNTEDPYFPYETNGNYVDDRRVFICTEANYTFNTNTNRNMGMTYGMYYMGSDVSVAGTDEKQALYQPPSGDGTRTWKFYRTARIPSPSRWIMLADTSKRATGSEGQPYSWFPSRSCATGTGGMWLAHGQRANVICGDNHLETFDITNATSYANGNSGGKKGIRMFLDNQSNLIDLRSLP